MDNQEDKPQAGQGNVQTSSGTNTNASSSGFSGPTPANPTIEPPNKPSDNSALVNNNQSQTPTSGQTGSGSGETGGNQSNINLDDYTSDVNNSESKDYNYPGSFDKSNDNDNDKKSRMGNIITIIVIIVVAAGIWQVNKKNSGQTGDSNDSNNVNIVVDSNPETGNVTIIGNENENIDSSISGDTVKIVAFYNKIGTNECENVTSLERIAEKKYDSDVINTVRGLLTPLSAEESAQGWISSIPDGTYVQKVTIKNGVAQAVFSSSLNKVAGSCRVLAIRSQIEKTLLQFPYIKSVNICIENNCNQDEILQP
ncbi:MAG: GerMN domain-containing protein [Candidatus Buchananbacteria bacterium]|nr:GerMN domain-containing protein [Candidatus Buchananbacteria bacterium]